jgi:hypothetical protein
VLLAHAVVELAAPAPVVLAELRVLVALGVGLLVLVPELHEREADLLLVGPQLLVDVLAIRLGAVRLLGVRRRLREHAGLKLAIGQRLGKGPRKASLLGALEIHPDGVPVDAACQGDLPVAQTADVLQTKYFSDAMHGQPLLCHWDLLVGWSYDSLLPNVATRGGWPESSRLLSYPRGRSAPK